MRSRSLKVSKSCIRWGTPKSRESCPISIRLRLYLENCYTDALSVDVETDYVTIKAGVWFNGAYASHMIPTPAYIKAWLRDYDARRPVPELWSRDLYILALYVIQKHPFCLTKRGKRLYQEVQDAIAR